MKKIYTAPLTKVVKIKAVNMLCASPEGFANSLAGIESARSAGQALSKDDYEDFDDFDESLW